MCRQSRSVAAARLLRFVRARNVFPCAVPPDFDRDCFGVPRIVAPTYHDRSRQRRTLTRHRRGPRTHPACAVSPDESQIMGPLAPCHPNVLARSGLRRPLAPGVGGPGIALPMISQVPRYGRETRRGSPPPSLKLRWAGWGCTEKTYQRPRTFRSSISPEKRLRILVT